MQKVNAPITVSKTNMLSVRHRLSCKVMFVGLCFSAGGLIPLAIFDNFQLSMITFCFLVSVAGYCMAFIFLPYKYQLWDDSTIVFEQYPWKRTIKIHLKQPFNSNLKMVARDIPKLINQLNNSNFHSFTFSSPILVKENGIIRNAPLKILAAQFAIHGYSMEVTTSKMPLFIKFVFNSEYKKFYRTNTVPESIQNNKWVTVLVNT